MNREDICCTPLESGMPEPTTIGEKEKALRDALIEIDAIVRGLGSFVYGSELEPCTTEEPKSLEENVSMNLYMARGIKSNLQEIRSRF